MAKVPNAVERFCISKVKEKDFLNNVYCIAIANVCNSKRDISFWISKQYRRRAFKTMYVQFYNETKSCAYWLVNETLWYETETFDFQSETRSRPRPSHVSTRPRRLETTSRDRDVETETTSLMTGTSTAWRQCFLHLCKLWSKSSVISYFLLIL